MNNARSGHMTFSDKIGATYDRMKAAERTRSDALGETFVIRYIGASGTIRETPAISRRRADDLVARFWANDKFPGVHFVFLKVGRDI